jgi:hypothetical protein
MVQCSIQKWGVRQVFSALVVVSSASLVSVSHAQHDHAASAPPTSSPVTLKFDSVLSQYKPMTDQKLGSWRDANDTVTRIGGWRAYLKQSQTPDATRPVPAAPSVPAPSPAPSQLAPKAADPHAGHGTKP